MSHSFLFYMLVFFNTLYIDLEKKKGSSFIQCNTLEQNCHGLLCQSILCHEKQNVLLIKAIL